LARSPSLWFLVKKGGPMRTVRSYVQEIAFNNWSISVSKAKASGLQFEKYILRRFLREFQIDCVFDVGANMGQFAHLIRSIGYTGPIVSFEPIPALADALKARAEADGCWSIEQIALDDDSREVTFHVTASTDFSSLKTPKAIEQADLDPYNKTTQTLTLKTGLLSNYIDKYRTKYGFSLPYLKLDTQGNDLAVARGAGVALNDFIGVQTELSIRPIYEDQPLFKDALSFFDRNGFAVSAFLPTHDHFPLLVEVDCILANRAKIAAARP
jgi:FkbM family methyltransferase